LTVHEERDAILVDTGPARFRISRDSPGPLQEVWLADRPMLVTAGSRTRLCTPDGHEYSACVDDLRVATRGPVSATIESAGRFVSRTRQLPLRFRSRLTLTAGSSNAHLEFRLHNPRAAHHPGGLWDLGDRGSVRFRDVSIAFTPATPASRATWYAEHHDEASACDPSHFTIYQDSSGGDNWDSNNHVDARGKATVSFAGYRASAGANGTKRTIAAGRRAQPCVCVSSDAGWMGATTENFWQNFPKALRVVGGRLEVGLFPYECEAGFELQGGEQKRHVVLLAFGEHEPTRAIAAMQSPLTVSIDPYWVEQSAAIPWFTMADTDASVHARYVEQIIDGPHSFFNKREIVDEYGWRNFGDVYADHEAVHHRGTKPLVSHFNNQYDFVYGALVHYLRTADPRWRQLMEDAGRHTIDIDVYHTRDDRPAYNGGLFWHTDHYLDAATSTHRTYSRRNGGRGYGGGPSNEHNYTSGLLHYYYLTGDRDAFDTVLELADWVVAMDDGAANLLGLVDAGPTGFATSTTTRDYHGPGRGAGNSINALLDAYMVCGERRYMLLAEALIQRCIHPADDIAARRLDAPEERWSYLVFLQVLGRYLHLKNELGEADYAFHYARESLLRYAAWMLDNEVPYKDVLHKVLIPTETWPAHDVRKSYVLNMASLHAGEPLRSALREKARLFFDRCLHDVLQFETAYLTRPLVILCAFGYVQSYFAKLRDVPALDVAHGYAFGIPVPFKGQRARLAAGVRKTLRMAARDARRLARDRWWDVKARVGMGP
jgi:hypothetical protein